ncbi:polysaccharide biosynthesis C-terminal domain-containing protein, partial [uncultured Parabacteroides sp.]
TGLAAGIIALACNSILSQYFIGSGKIRYSAGSSFVGLTSLLISGYLLIPLYGVVGSAISSSISFSAMLIFSMIIFCRKTGTRLREFLLNKEDVRFALRKLRPTHDGSQP